MKKLLSLIIAVTLVISVLPAAMPVFAQGEYTVHYFNTYEDESTAADQITAYNGCDYTFDADTYADTVGIGSALHLVTAGEKDGINIKFANGSASISEDTYLEIELDFLIAAAGGGNCSNNQLKFAPNASNFMYFLGNSFRTENPSNTVAGVTGNVMHRYKIILKAADNGDARAWQLVGFEIDGVKKISDKVYTSSNLTKDISSFRLRWGAATNGDYVFIDNLSIISYVSEDGTSPVPDRYALLKAATDAKAAADKGYENAEISDNFYAGIKGKIDDAVAVFRDIESTSADLAAAIDSMDSVNTMIDASAKMMESGALYYVDYENNVFDGDITLDAAVNVRIPVYTAVSDSGIPLKTLAFVYSDDADLATPALVDVVPVTAEVPADSAGELVVPLDLSVYEDPSALSAKIVVVEDYNEIAGAVPADYIATKDDAPVGDGYSFVGDVSVSKVILNDDPDTEDFKVVYALSGTKEESVSVLVLKPGADIADISTDPESVIEYYNTAVFDANGKAVFEFAPKTMDYYTYIINAEGEAAYEDKVFYASLGDIDDIITKVYSDKTLDNLTSVEKDAASLNSPVIDAADAAGVDMDSVLKETLSERAYNARTLSDFTANLFNKLNIVTLFRTADSSDTVMDLIDTYGSDIEKISEINALSPSEKQTAYTYLFNNRSSIDDMASLNDEVSDAADEADKPAETPKKKNNGGGGSGGIVISPIVTPPEDEVKEPTIMQQTSALFTDLDSVSWAESAIVEFAANGWVNGKSEGMFSPNDSITREEFVKMAVNVFGFYDADAQCSFADTADGSWHYDYIASAASKGIVNGVSDTEFGVGSTITRQDMAVIIYRIAKLCGLQLTEDGEYLPFADEIHISEYAFEAVTELTKSGIINGADNNSFLPAGLATRAEAVKMLYGAYNLK